MSHLKLPDPPKPKNIDSAKFCRQFDALFLVGLILAIAVGAVVCIGAYSLVASIGK